MKKIVALVLAMVMVLGLATTASALTLWNPNANTEGYDIYRADDNTKMVDGAAITFDAGSELALNKDGSIKTYGKLPNYTITVPYGSYRFESAYGVQNVFMAGQVPGYFVLVDSIPVDADASYYYFVKAHNAKVEIGAQLDWDAQSANDPYYILKYVKYAIDYSATATLFTAWSDDCEAYEEPANAETVKYYTISNKTPELTNAFVKVPAVTVAGSSVDARVLVDGEIVELDKTAANWQGVTAHSWVASKWDVKKNVTEFTCVNCKTVGTVVNSPINAPAGSKLDMLPGGVLVAYNMAAVEAPVVDTEKVESAETFDAGIAMYVGMSVMAAAGSAVVLKKKD